ncbi:hypothetical protein LMG22037_05664 [Paraburkholderia phenoliruptrix]|jgi:hypothetical protein|uniref:Thioredoxin-like fold domain-containing protein n=1 Tax=Paraburkholderia phenoliruptrix TaxID=252970 RepID=A0A6J5CES0_9BURK|nr:hypothetical protein [Paraburkholderia phenoliruptrix]CAB3732004.1 hypothetical protein LMG22037_05664 [Paraburkholderia phenoliruptrix]
MKRRHFLRASLGSLATIGMSASGALARAATGVSERPDPPRVDLTQLHFIVDERSLGRTPLWFILDSGCSICRTAYSDLRSRAALHDRTFATFQVRFVPVGDTHDSAQAAARAFAAHSMEGFFVPGWDIQLVPGVWQTVEEDVKRNTAAARTLPGYPAFVIEGRPIKLGYDGWHGLSDWLSS